MLALSGIIGSGVLLAATPEATDNLASTSAQLGGLALLLALLGPRSARRAMDAAPELGLQQAGSGEPTPLWQLPAICAALSLPLGALVGWDAALRVTLGCALVGLSQALLIERTVAARERRAGGRYIRMPGSRILRGTRLGRLVPAPR